MTFINQMALFITGLVFFQWQMVLAQPNYEDWAGNGYVTVNAGLPASAVLANYPLLIRLDEKFPFSQVKAGGADLRVSKEGEPLPFEIEEWNPSEKRAALWVLLGEVNGSSAGDKLTLHWGNPKAESESNSQAVFNVNNNFVGVWHFNNNPDSIADATPNNNLGVYMGTSDFDFRPGIAGGGVYFHGQKWGYVNAGHSESLNMSETAVTLSAWVKPPSQNEDNMGGIAGKCATRTKFKEYCLYQASSYRWEFSFTNGGGRYGSSGRVGASVEDTWTMTTGVVGDRMIAFWNGDRKSSSDGKFNMYYSENTDNFVIGQRYDAEQVLNFLGIIDEVRLSNTTRSDEWINLNYRSQKPDQTVVSGFVLVQAAEEVIHTIHPEFNLQTTPGGLYSQIALFNTLVVYDLKGRVLKNIDLTAIKNAEDFIRHLKPLPQRLYIAKTISSSASAVFKLFLK